MDLVSDHAYWTLRDGLLRNYPPLTADLRCEVAVLGAGVSGALIGETLSAAGHDVAIFDKRDAGWGSTSASTALLQYEIDAHLHDLMKKYGEGPASQAYRACYEAIDWLETIIRSRGIDCDFLRVPSVYFASRKRDAIVLGQEAEARKRAGIPVDYWSADDIASRFPFSRAAALHSEQAAQLDPYRLTHGLLARVVERGGSVHDRTEVTKVETRGHGVRLGTARGFNVQARWLVVASGYESVEGFPVGKLVALRSTFAVASEPVIGDPWWRRALLWESSRPYFYLRTTGDSRIMIGGEDSPFRNPAARDRQLPKKCAALGKRFREWFPDRPFEPGYAWAGTFGETKDGLPYIGEHPDWPRCLFALGFGGNGIVYSAVAAQAIAAHVAGKPSLFGDVFGFNR